MGQASFNNLVAHFEGMFRVNGRWHLDRDRDSKGDSSRYTFISPFVDICVHGGEHAIVTLLKRIGDCKADKNL